MIAPAAMLVEAAVDTIGDAQYQQDNAAMLAEQDKQIRSALPGRSDAFYSGYALGLATARVYLSGNMVAVKAGVTL